MNTAVALLFFLIINYKGIRYALSNGSFTLKASLKPEKEWSFTSREMLILLTLVCAPISAAPFGQLAVRLLFWILIILIAFLLTSRPVHFPPAAFYYSLYLAWLLISMFLTPYRGYGFRVFAKYLLPFLMMMFAAKAVETPNVLVKGVKYVFVIFEIELFYSMLHRIGLEIIFSFWASHIFWWQPAILDSFSVLLPVVITAYIIYRDKQYLFLIPLMILISVLGYVVRTGLVAMFISAVMMVVFRYKWKSLPVLFLVFMLGISSVVFIPKVRNKMFYREMTATELVNNFDRLTIDDINSNGRFAMWEVLLDRLYLKNPIRGHGIGSTQHDMYEELKELFGGLEVPHNDYIQILCDTGLIGFFLYLIMILSLVLHSYALYNDQNLSLECRYAAFIAGTSICGMAAAMMTDNVVNYTMTTLVYPFTFYGIAIALKHMEMQNVQRNHSSLQQSNNH